MKKFLKLLLLLVVVAVVAFTILWFARPADVSFDEVRAGVPNSNYSHFAEIDGVRIHYQEKGTGTPLVLLHGYTSSTYSWKEVFEPLAKSFHVIAVDLKGFGGEVALNVALDNPERVAGLILIDSLGVQVPGSGSLAPSYLLIPVVGRLLTALALRSDKLVRAGLEKSFYDRNKVTNERVAAYYLPLQTRGGQLAALRARTQIGQFPVETELGRINVDTLILWGAQDALIPVAAGHKLNALIKRSKLVTFDNCGHLPQEEMPARTIDEMTRFIAGQDPAKK